MSYPLTSAVAAGDATLASHYNNLRLDAIYLGHDTSNAVPLGTALERYESRLTLERLFTARVRVPASATAPVSLIIAGYLVQTITNVDLDAGLAPSAGAPAPYYVFANRTAGSTSFTLTISTSITELANQRRIGRFYWDGTNIVKDSVRTELSEQIADLMYFLDPQVCGGRLTLSTAVPVPTSDIASSGLVYFTPYTGNRVSLYVKDYGWRVYAFGELTLNVSGFTANANYDVFIFNSAGTLTLAATQWSNNTLRAVALTRQDGVWVKSSSPEYRYLGTIRMDSSAGLTCDTQKKRFVWNMYNRVEREILLTEVTNSWTYVTDNVWRALNNDWANNLIKFVIGIDECLLTFESHVFAENSGANEIGVGVGFDKFNNNDGLISKGSKNTAAVYNADWYGSIYKGYPPVGYHYVSVVELSGGGTTTFYGDNATASKEQLSGGIGSIFM